jgi:flavodoxin
MKKFLSVLLVLCCVFSLFSMTGCAAENTEAAAALSIILQIDNPMMTVNGTEKEIDSGRGTVPVVINDRTLVPVRAIVEEMGGSVSWNEDTQTAALYYNGDEIRLTIDSQTAYFKDEAHTLDVAPTVINDRTMLPIRFVAESFKFDVAWDEAQQLITITKNTSSDTPSEPTTEPSEPAKSGGALVVYFSATGNTKSLAEKIAAATEADLVEIVPAEPYTSEDLNYNNNNCRANLEMNDSAARPAISNTIENIDSYDTIMLGYPIWWGTMPKIINTFLESYDLSGKTIMPFCTSGGSGISSSVSAIRSICTNSTVTDGFRGSASASDAQIQEWLGNSNYVKAAPQASRGQ